MDGVVLSHLLLCVVNALLERGVQRRHVRLHLIILTLLLVSQANLKGRLWPAVAAASSSMLAACARAAQLLLVLPGRFL